MTSPGNEYVVYLLCWRRHGGLQYIGLSRDVDRRIDEHRKARSLPFAQFGDPVVEVLHSGFDLYVACAAERREIIARRTMTPHGYNESLGGEYAGPRRVGAGVTWSIKDEARKRRERKKEHLGAVG